MPFNNRISTKIVTFNALPRSSSAGTFTLPYAPQLWYKSEDIPGSWGSWTNSGSLGTGYNLTPYSGSPSITTQNGYKAIAFSGNNLAFTNGADLVIHQSSQSTPFTLFTVARLDSGAYIGFLGSYNQASSRPNGIGAYNHPTHQEWYDNDGAISSQQVTSATNSVLAQYTYLHRNNNGIEYYEGKTPGAYASFSGSYGANMTVRGMGHIRTANPTGASVVEMIFAQSELSNANIQATRDYFAAKFPAGRVNS
jgi:hypothetical protein